MVLVFDMDGTIANLYSVDNWLEKLRADNAEPFEIAEPLINIEELQELLCKCKENNILTVICSWLPKQASKEYKQQVRQAKKNWLAKYNLTFDKVHLVQYGTNKRQVCKQYKNAILIDDDIKNINQWNGITIKADSNIINNLKGLII